MEASNQQQEQDLIEKSKIFREKLNHFQTAIETYRVDKMLDKFKVEIEILKDAFADLIDAEQKFWPKSESLEQTNHYFYKSFDIENDYFNLLADANQLIREEEVNVVPMKAGVSSQGASSTKNFPSTSKANCSYLPKVRLPRFSGRYEDWNDFAAKFKSAIHDNITLNDGMRFLYLKYCLDRETENTIKNITNYNAAWKFLNDLFLSEYERNIRSEGIY